MDDLNISEIFYSLQGEARDVGRPTVFIRLIGCPLRCSYCDTQYAFYGNNILKIKNIIEQIKKYQTNFVCITGGEPLAQKNCIRLMDALVAANYAVSLETGGHLDISPVPAAVAVVMDLKTPSSGECDKNRYQNVALLKNKDQLKFVIGNREDFDWSVQILKNYPTVAEVFFSPVFETMNPTMLGEWILEKQLPVRLQIQLHKILWNDERGR